MYSEDKKVNIKFSKKMRSKKSQQQTVHYYRATASDI